MWLSNGDFYKGDIVFADNIECTQLILRIILQQDIVVKKVETQSVKRVFPGHSVEFDIDAVDQNDIPIDIEIQRADKGAGEKRARYHSSVIDTHTLLKNENYNTLKESFVIFLTESDFFGAGLPLYHIERKITELDNKIFEDGSHIIYVNGAYDGDDSIGKLMHDFRSLESENMNYKELAEQVKYYKETEEGVTKMCKIMEEIYNDGKEEQKKEMVRKLLVLGKLSYEEIADCAQLPMDVVEKIASEQLMTV